VTTQPDRSHAASARYVQQLHDHPGTSLTDRALLGAILHALLSIDERLVGLTEMAAVIGDVDHPAADTSDRP
jgi:hypothetical protein